MYFSNKNSGWNKKSGDGLLDSSHTPVVEDKDVVVIGGGCAGIECAAKLLSYGFRNIVVLEAQDYIGGRIKTHYDIIDECSPIEIGANWIHGSWDNPLCKVIKENPDFFQHKKANLFDISADAAYFADEYGNEIDFEMAHTLYDEYIKWNYEAKAIWEKKLPCGELKNYTEFMWHKLEANMNEANDSAERRRVKGALLKQMLKQETSESGCHIMDLCNLKEYGSYSRMTGPDYEFPGGFGKLIEYISRDIPKSCIKLRHPVKNIRPLDIEESGESVVDENQQQQQQFDNVILVECENGSKFRTKHVVVTCSVNYLQRHFSTLFDPCLLTEKKIEAINTVQMSTVDKIFLFYDDLASFFPHDSVAVKPVFLDERPRSTPEEMKENWWYKVYTFDKFYDNVLLVWLTGEEANYAETLPEHEIIDTLTSLLKRLLKNDNVPRPKSMLFTDWNSNPYMLGSYSYIDVKGAVKHINNLAEPIYVNKVPRILFAGEATHNRYYSTVHAAYISGQREAKRIHDYYSAEK